MFRALLYPQSDSEIPQAASQETESGFPSWKERNVRLKKDIKVLLEGDRAAINKLKDSASALR